MNLALVRGRFSGHECASELTLRKQRALVNVALEFAAADHGADLAMTVAEERPYLAARHAALCELAALFAEHVIDDIVPGDEMPGVPALLGEYCRVCGCSGHDACDGFFDPCAWAQPGLCSRCAVKTSPREQGPATPSPELHREARPSDGPSGGLPLRGDSDHSRGHASGARHGSPDPAAPVGHAAPGFSTAEEFRAHQSARRTLAARQSERDLSAELRLGPRLRARMWVHARADDAAALLEALAARLRGR